MNQRQSFPSHPYSDLYSTTLVNVNMKIGTKAKMKNKKEHTNSRNKERKPHMHSYYRKRKEDGTL